MKVALIGTIDRTALCVSSRVVRAIVTLRVRMDVILLVVNVRVTPALRGQHVLNALTAMRVPYAKSVHVMHGVQCLEANAKHIANAG